MGRSQPLKSLIFATDVGVGVSFSFWILFCRTGKSVNYLRHLLSNRTPCDDGKVPVVCGSQFLLACRVDCFIFRNFVI